MRIDPATAGPAGGEPPDLAADLGASVGALEAATDGSLAAVILFGSRLLGTSPDRHSATDLFLIVEDYSVFYAGLHAAGITSRSPLLLRALNHWLAPNVISVPSGDAKSPGSKCFVIRVDHFERAMSAGARDHFCKGRLAQRVEVIYARDAERREAVHQALERAREDTLRWVPAHLPAVFGIEDFCLRMLEVSYAGEIRPENRDRVREVFAAQRGEICELYSDLLKARGAAHGIEAAGDRYRQSAKVPAGRRWRSWLYFRHSTVRATLRWLKYTLTFDDWLDYIVLKIRRRTGMQLEISEAERRWPLLLLWPKFFAVLGMLRRSRPGGERS